MVADEIEFFQVLRNIICALAYLYRAMKVLANTLKYLCEK